MGSVAIKVFPVELSNKTLVIKSYQILLKRLVNESELKIPCNKDGSSCSTIAEISNELVTADGYVLYIGDGKLYGGYVNSALVPKSSYSVQIFISVWLPEYYTTIYQQINEATMFKAPPEHCNPLSSIPNAIFGDTINLRMGERVVCACDDGYQKTGGDATRTCSLADDYTSFWNGSSLKCEVPNNLKLQNIVIGMGVGGAALLIAVAVVVAVVIIRRRRNSTEENNEATEENEMGEYEESSVPQPSNYTVLKLDGSSREEEADTDDGVYERVSGSPPVPSEIYSNTSD